LALLHITIRLALGSITLSHLEPLRRWGELACPLRAGAVMIEGELGPIQIGSNQ